MRVAPAVDALALDEFEDQVALAGRQQTGIEQLGDVRMVEPAEHPTLAREALVGDGVRTGQAHELDRRATVVQAIGSACQPDVAHAAAADQAFDQLGAEAVAFEPRQRRLRRRRSTFRNAPSSAPRSAWMRATTAA